MVKVHNIRFYNPSPRAIYCTALQKSESKLAVSRADASVEIWNIQRQPFIERIIPSTPDHSIEGLEWCDDRLFSVGLDGLIVEYDLFALTKKTTSTVTGQAAFCLHINQSQTHIAVGTEQGYLNIFNITDDGVSFEKFLDKQEGRLLCLKYDSTGKFIASGGTDAIRIWNVDSGHAIHKMTTGRSEVNKSTIVWCLDIIDDFVIITGDSRGKLTFWDGHMGAQIESYQSHKADILSLAVSDDQKTLFCAGADPNIMSYVKVQVKNDSHKWMKNIQRKIHDHDVRALLLHGNKLYSAGVDGYLAVSYHPPKTLLKYPPFLRNNCVTVCPKSRVILLQHSSQLEVWKLGTKDNMEAKKLLVLERSVKTDCGTYAQEGIICSAMSSDAKWIVYSTDTITRLFSINYDEGMKPTLESVTLPSECSVSINAVFSPDGLQLVLALRRGNIAIVNLEENILQQELETKKFLSDIVMHLTMSACGKYFVAADPKSNIVVWTRGQNHWKYYSKLARYDCPPTALAIHPKKHTLVVAYADHKVVEYGLSNRKFSNYSTTFDSSKLNRCLHKAFPVRNITFDLKNQDVVILHDDSRISAIHKKGQSEESPAKVAKLTPPSKTNGASTFNPVRSTYSSIKKYKHLVHLECLSEDEMVVVEVNPLALLTQLPPCFKQNTFGTK